MSSFARSLIICSTIAALALPLRAQEPSENGPQPSDETLQDWLHSGDPRLEAWAAHDLLRARDENLIPDLLNLTDEWQPLTRQACEASPCSVFTQDQADARDAMAAVLDTLIQMNVAVRPEALRNLAPDFDNDVSILLARMPDEDSTQLKLDFYHSPPPPSYSVQYVSAALLASHPPEGFAADLLSSIKIRGTIYIVLDDSHLGFGSGFSCGVGAQDPREGWPMTGQYALSDQKSNGASLVVGGIKPVYALRTESRSYAGENCGMGIGLVPAGRRAFVAEMLGISPDAIPWQLSFQTNIKFQSVEQTEADILAFVQEQQQAYRETATALADRDLMAPSDIEDSLPELDLEIDDVRGLGFIPLPPLMNLPPRVKLLRPGGLP